MAASDMKLIRLELARTKAFPNGSPHHGYEFFAPLDAAGHIDAEAWKKLRGECRVRRFWGEEGADEGMLVHRPGGSWAFRWTGADDEDDEAGWRFATHAFVVGEYVSIRDEDGALETFSVVAVDDV